MRQLFRRPGPEARLVDAARQQAATTEEWRLLVVEDDPLFMQIVVDIAEPWDDVDLRCVEDLAGLEAEAAWRPDVVLLDLELPDSGGLDTLARCLRVLEGSSIVVFTGSDEDGLGLEAVRHGAQDFIPKGEMDERLLRRTLRFALERRRLEQVKRDVVRQKTENERLRAIQEERSRFYQGVTDQLRGPLESLGVQTSLLGHELQAQRQHRHTVESIHEQVERLARLSAELVDIAAIQAGGLHLPRQQVDLSDLVAEALPTWEGEARSARLVLDSLVEPGIVVDVEPRRLREVLDRILENAVRHTPAGGAITLSLEGGEHATITIRDNGCGVIKERLDRIFEAYLWGPEARTGMGMGLAIARGIVEAFDGSIEVSSKDGTTVCIRVPLAKSYASS